MNTSAKKNAFFTDLSNNLNSLREQGLYKPERVISSRQGSLVQCDDGRELIHRLAGNRDVADPQILAHLAQQRAQRCARAVKEERAAHERVRAALGDRRGRA